MLFAALQHKILGVEAGTGFAKRCWFHIVSGTHREAIMILTAIAVTFALSVVVFLLVARSAPMLNEDGSFEAMASQSIRNDQAGRTL